MSISVFFRKRGVSLRFFTLALILLLSPLYFGGNRLEVLYPFYSLIFFTGIFYQSDMYFFLKKIDPFIKKALFVFCILTFISSLNTFCPGSTFESVLYGFAIISIVFFAYGVSAENALTLCYLMIGSGVGQVVISLLGMAQVFPHSYWNPPDFVAGTFVNHNHFAGYLEVTFPLTLALLFFEKSQKARWVLGGSALFQIAGLILSQSRGGWLGIIFSLIFFLAISLQKFRRRLFICLGVTVFLGLAAWLLPLISDRVVSIFHWQEDLSVCTRLKIWEATLGMIRKNLWIGTGPGTFSNVFPFFRVEGLDGYVNHAHNEYLEWISETGILTVLFLVFFIFKMIKRGVVLPVEYSPFPFACGFALLATSIHVIFDFNPRIPAIGFYLAVLAGLSFNERINPMRYPD